MNRGKKKKTENSEIARLEEKKKLQFPKQHSEFPFSFSKHIIYRGINN